MPPSLRTLLAPSWIPLFCVLLGCPSPALAEEKAPASQDALKETASTLFDRGIKAMDEQRWEDCRAAFLAALNIHRHYQVAGNLALCEAKLGRYTEAAEHVSFSLREMPATAPPERKAVGESLLKEIRPKVAEVSIVVNKTDAEVLVDGRSVGRSPLASPVFVEPGDRKLEAKFGDAIARGTTTAKAGGAQTITLTIEDAPRPAPGWRPPLPLILASGGLALVGIGTGIGLTVAANDKASEGSAIGIQIGGGASECITNAASKEDACKRLTDAWRSKDALANSSTAILVAGGVLAAGTVGLVLWRASKSDAEAPRVTATAGPTGAFAAVSATW